MGIEVPEPHFTLLETERSGSPEILVVNDALLPFAHKEIFPWHLEITIEARELADNGMPTREESAELDKLGDEIEAAVIATRTSHGSDNVLFLSRSTWSGQRELAYRVHEPETVNAVLTRLVEGNNAREWSYEMHQDDEWADAMPMLDLVRSSRGDAN